MAALEDVLENANLGEALQRPIFEAMTVTETDAVDIVLKSGGINVMLNGMPNEKLLVADDNEFAFVTDKVTSLPTHLPLDLMGFALMEEVDLQ